VVDVGAPVTAVIVRCELGISSIASVNGAPTTSPDGAVVSADGSSGTITVIELPEG